MSFFSRIFGKNSKDKQIIKEPENELMNPPSDELMVQEEQNNNIEKDEALNNKDSP